MRAWTICAALLVFVGLIGRTVRADVQPYFVQVPISSAAITADPTLSNYKTWDLRVTVTGPSDDPSVPDFFTVGSIFCQLSAGSFYSPVGGGDLPVTSGAANIAFDTFITGPAPEDIEIAGKGDNTKGSAVFPEAGGQQSVLNVTWAEVYFGVSSFPHNGDFQIARLTVSNDATGAVNGLVTSSGHLRTPPPEIGYSAQFAQGTLSVTPEPGTLGVLGSIGFMLLRRRVREQCHDSTELAEV